MIAFKFQLLQKEGQEVFDLNVGLFQKLCPIPPILWKYLYDQALYRAFDPKSLDTRSAVGVLLILLVTAVVPGSWACVQRGQPNVGADGDNTIRIHDVKTMEKTSSKAYIPIIVNHVRNQRLRMYISRSDSVAVAGVLRNEQKK